MLGKDGPDDSKTLAVMRQAEDWEFTRNRRERALDLGHVMRKTQWELERVNTYPLSGDKAWDVHPTRDGGMAVGYYGGGLEMFTVDGPVKKILENVMNVERIATLSDGRYIIRSTQGSNTTLIMYSNDWKREPVKFHTPSWSIYTAGLCVDNHDNIYVGDYLVAKIAVFRPEGGEPIKEITIPGLNPWCIRHMNHSNLMVVKGGSTVRVIDEEGTVKHDVIKDGSSIVVLQDDSILIALEEDGLLTIDLYTPQLKYVRTVLSKFKIEIINYCLAEFSTGEIAFSDRKKLYVFHKT